MDQSLKSPGAARPRRRLDLERNSMLHLWVPAGGHIGVDTGLLWVTQIGRPYDWMLTAGQGLRLTPGGCVTVSTLSGSSLWLHLSAHPWRVWSAVLVHADGDRVRLGPERGRSLIWGGLQVAGRRLVSLRGLAARSGSRPTHAAAGAAGASR